MIDAIISTVVFALCAYPIIIWINSLHKKRTLAILAASAPPIPVWFKPEGTPKPPQQPKAWWEYPTDYPRRSEIENWHKDSCYDLPEEMQWYQKPWENHWKERAEYNKHLELITGTQWRSYWAKQMMEELY